LEKEASDRYGCISDVRVDIKTVLAHSTATSHHEEPIGATPNDYAEPRISPDGTKVALTLHADITSDIWIWDLIRENMTRLTFNEHSNNPLWIPDGRRVAFASDIGDEEGVYGKAADGTGNDELLHSAPDREIFPRSWSSDGNTLVTLDRSGPGLDIGSLSMEGDHAHKPLLQKEYVEARPQISSDGKRFLMMKPPEIPEAADEESTSDEPRKINIVLNWFEELKERVPVE
jgi:Tol biopolymer transport system component